ncbi:MAG: hypothetical protein JST89_23440 [Cyanobacteria bacterium SZAS-4]|nr:hypothetical protein [Cyanobacteria bacterium SZAS-4]
MLAALAFVLVNLVLYFGGPNEKAKLTLESLGDLNLAKNTGRLASWWIANSYLSEKTPPDVVLFGSSQLGGLQAADADLLKKPQDYVLDHKSVSLEEELKRHKLSANCFAIGIVGCMASDQLMLSKVLLSRQNSPKLLIATVSPRDFIDGHLPSITSTEIFKWYSPYVSNAAIADEFLSDPIEKASWLATSGLPLRSIYHNGQHELETTEPVTDMGAKPHKRLAADPLLTTNNESMVNIRPGQCIVTPNMPKFFVDNSNDYKKRYSNWHGTMYRQQIACFNKFLASAKARGIHVLVVGMPLDSSNASLLPEAFWSDYRNQIQTACSGNGATFLELSHDNEFGRGDFVDGVHLSARGGSKIARRMSNTIASTPGLVTAFRTHSGSQIADATTH